ncbi:MAG: hypothetical protein U1E27_13760 [Kiritimatiellia bacterium]|nr:hypothetical protein [Kiritimatiellia bacterium]
MKRKRPHIPNPIRGATALPMAALVILLGAAVPGHATDSVSDFERYQPIAKRNPFGSPPAPAAPTPAAAASAAQFRMSALVEIVGAVRVGLVDLQTQRSLYLRVGESEEGIELVSADSSQEQAVIRRGAETLTLRLQEGTPAPAVPVVASPQPPMSGGPPEAVRSRRDQILQQMRERREAARLAAAQTGGGSANVPVPPTGAPAIRTEPDGHRPRVTGPEMERRLQEYQMEVIRQGLPPLPIPLTEEMDKQLVAEGVLPPQ